MPRNTFIVVSLLAVLAALVVGVNIGRSLNLSNSTSNASPQVPTSAPTVIPTPKLLEYTNTSCRFSLHYPDVMKRMDDGVGSVVLINSLGNDSIIITCQKAIPRPDLVDKNIETISIGSLSAQLYHETSTVDNSPIDKLFLKHPTTNQDILVTGFGPSFQSIISSLKIIE